MKRSNYNFNREHSHDAIIEGLRRYFGDAGYEGDFVIGLSGGIDSALVAYFAVEAFGKKRVHGMILPSNTTSEKSIDLAMKLSNNLGIDAHGLPIGKINDDFVANFEKNYDCELGGLARGNIAARLRMISLMTASNEFGWKILNTGNRTEAMLGYCTLFGDTVGEYAPIGDVLKTEIYQLAEMINLISKSRDGFEVIPHEIISRPATAELVDGQTDEKEIGASYATIDRILWGRFAQDMTVDEFVAFGFDGEVVMSILARVSRNAFKAKFYAPHPVIHKELN
ncbi:NAD(+) synthase [Phoenicibacter congonensis]|uniref:NAD(+) synthase n=1 Tax=Phoenicibacter congonensis TaxID=1944646 RepID=UPI0009A67D86|nr:NAD(+) synthase [Phoenicibacter congonensis]